MAHAIQSVSATKILDSRGKPTISVTLATERTSESASVPMGASTGSREAKVLDADISIALIQGEVAAALAGKKFDQQTLDDFLIQLDGTPNKARLGAGATLGVSMAFARAAATEASQPLYAYLAGLAGTTPALPCPMFNVINGGKHAKGGLSVQEFLFVPTGIATIVERLRAGEACIVALQALLEERGEATNMGDEGGFAPKLHDTGAALDLLATSVITAGYAVKDIRLSIDAAASSFKKGDVYNLDGSELSAGRLCERWEALAKQYNLLSIEDPFGEEDMGSFAALQARIGAMVVGDDLTVTNVASIAAAAHAGAVRAVILKPNQVGTVSETIAAAQAARRESIALIASHRSGETLDTFIADLSVGLSCEYIKAGAPTRPERMAKYHRLVAIAAQLEKTA